MKLRSEVESRQRGDLSLREDGTVVMGQRLCVPDVCDVRREIMEEAHSSAYAMHPGSTKMYEEGYCRVRLQMSHMSAGESRT